MKRTRKPSDRPKRKGIKTSSAKAKGQSLQKWVCERISEVLGLPWGRDEVIAPRESGQPGTDVRLVGEARARFPFAVECKNQQSWSVHQWIDQAKSNQESGQEWLLIGKRNRMKPVVIMDAERFFDLLRIIEHQGGDGSIARMLQGEGPTNGKEEKAT